MFRIGFGYDSHQLVEGRALVIGGIEIPHHLGLAGHSDADVLTHAIIDALMGALALGDIGQHFPDTDPNYKDVNSLQLLQETMKLVEQKEYLVGNVDCTTVADEPKMAPHIPIMRETLAKVLKIEKDNVSIKATRTEGVLFQSQSGVVVLANALVIAKNSI